LAQVSLVVNFPHAADVTIDVPPDATIGALNATIRRVHALPPVVVVISRGRPHTDNVTLAHRPFPL
jgi:hypothetical protein